MVCSGDIQLIDNGKPHAAKRCIEIDIDTVQHLHIAKKFKTAEQTVETNNSNRKRIPLGYYRRRRISSLSSENSDTGSDCGNSYANFEYSHLNLPLTFKYTGIRTEAVRDFEYLFGTNCSRDEDGLKNDAIALETIHEHDGSDGGNDEESSSDVPSEDDNKDDMSAVQAQLEEVDETGEVKDDEEVEFVYKVCIENGADVIVIDD